MSIEQYLNLLISLSSSALNIWGFLLTVSLGIVAFLGSVNTVRLPLAFVLCLLFIGFSYSNHYALKRNIEQREAIISVIEKQEYPDSEFKEAVALNQPIIDTFKVNSDRKKAALILQITASTLVALLIVGWPILQIGLTRRSSGTREKTSRAP